ncbi:MAG: DUF3079 domain-containing protein [Acidobacteria bacterium]|nr:DUF3079 domain-containing protein [Acidobacteriota bacterium]
MKETFLHPRRPERVCWGCEKLCPADDLACGNGTIRTPHPVELFGDDWLDWSRERNETSAPGLCPSGATASPRLEGTDLDGDAARERLTAH